jgi:GNAT superfamily N-acetyltransferase
MTDMLVKLYQLPPLEPVIAAQQAAGVTIRRGLPAEKHVVLKWIGEHFSPLWVSETDVAFAHVPIGCFLAVEGETLLGFGVYDVVSRGFFGPTGVSEAARGRGIGAALLLACLHDMYAQGYGYGIIGGVGPAEFYEKVAGAMVIPDSTPGVFAGMLRGD